MLKPEERQDNFNPIEHGYTQAMAVCESRRCLGCAAGALQHLEKCADCLTCLRVCPYSVPVIGPEGNVVIRADQCQACGLCLTVCPNLAIEFRTPYIKEAEEAMEEVMAQLIASRNGKPLTLALCCGYGGFALKTFTEEYVKAKPPHIGVVRFPCISKIDTLHILKAFERGIDKVAVVGCSEDQDGDCPFQKTLFWAERRVDAATRLLKDIGLGENRLFLLTLSMDQVPRFGEHLERALA